MTWYYGSRVFNAFSSAILRLASWDFEISSDTDVPLPICHSSIPGWQFPEDNRYWFHGFLIMLKPDLESPELLRTAVGEAKGFINSSNRIPRRARAIFISPNHVAFADLSKDTISCSVPLPLLIDSAATECSPGFRLLAQVLSSSSSGTIYDDREKWDFTLPPEVMSQVLHSSEPRDAVSFAQASFKVQRWYYASVPQLSDVSIPSLDISIPCCGNRTGLEDSGLKCRRCFRWQHQACLGLESPPEGPFTCSACLEEKPESNCLTVGGIHRRAMKTCRFSG